MQECNPARNSWLQTHPDDESRGGVGEDFALNFKSAPRMDRFAHALKTHAEWLRFARGCKVVRAASLCGSWEGSKPALRRSLRR